eukprot:TRINITY_DN732_c0_g1_i3.p3 TRINITY_DN732_c0_g1~~TRINITY_DN732_c0_g1_i3.p3  ORF type:complete len:200 (+),score=58.72 TRINITY_DN732_c0_g1_i3:65-664(+)
MCIRDRVSTQSTWGMTYTKSQSNNSKRIQNTFLRRALFLLVVLHLGLLQAGAQFFLPINYDNPEDFALLQIEDELVSQRQDAGKQSSIEQAGHGNQAITEYSADELEFLVNADPEEVMCEEMDSYIQKYAQVLKAYKREKDTLDLEDLVKALETCQKILEKVRLLEKMRQDGKRVNVTLISSLHISGHYCEHDGRDRLR